MNTPSAALKIAYPPWALLSVKWAVSKGLIKGSVGSLDPTGSATRAQAATILQRFTENTAK